MTTTTEPTITTNTPTAEPAENDKIVKIKDIAYDLSTSVGILRAALAIECLTDDQLAAHNAMAALPEEMIANVLSAGLIKPLRAAIKAAQKPDHDAIWYGSMIPFGGTNRPVANLIADVRGMIERLNVHMAEYNELNKDTNANIRPLVLDGGSSRKRANGERNERSYVRLARALLEHKIGLIHYKARAVQFDIRQRNADGTIVYEFQHDKVWRHISELNKACTEIAKVADVSAPDTWRACTVKPNKDADPVMLGTWYDENVKDANAE